MGDLSFWLRLANIAFSVFVVTLAFLKLIADSRDRARAIFILGLTSLTIYVAMTAYELRYEEFSFRIPLATLGLFLAAYGLHIMHRTER